MALHSSHPPWLPVKSTNIEAIAYHPEANVLHVKFKDGAHYSYAGVPRATYHLFLKSDSKGSFFHEHIKGKFQHHKVT